MKTQLIDSFNRKITSLRIAVTDKCNLRCIYCVSADETKFLERSGILTFEEITRLAQIIIGLGVNKIRLTGGEPLIRKDIPKLIKKLSQIEGLVDLSLTTNGVMLKNLAEELYLAGLRRINVSLDTLNPKKYTQLTRGDVLTKVLDGLDAAQKCGFSPIKINVVAMRGFTEEDVWDFVHFARIKGFQVRFIEFMPLDGDDSWGIEKVIPAEEIVHLINAVQPVEPVDNIPATASAKLYRFKDGIGEIGVVSSVSNPFCDNCNRIRLTADGKLRTCLFSLGEIDLKSLVRNRANDQEIEEVIIEAVRNKERGHKINNESFVKPARNMSLIGG